MYTQRNRPVQAIAITHPRADGPMTVAGLAVILASAIASVAIFAAGWQIGGFLLKLLNI